MICFLFEEDYLLAVIKPNKNYTNNVGFLLDSLGFVDHCVAVSAALLKATLEGREGTEACRCRCMVLCQEKTDAAGKSVLLCTKSTWSAKRARFLKCVVVALP